MSRARVLVVDDSATMRSLVSSVLRGDPEIEVVGQAGDPREAREAIKALNPDVVTLDIEMPNMSGLEFLEKIMRLRPMPVIMISTLTQRGADASLQALELGAFDCIGKPMAGSSPAEAFAELPAKVKAAWHAKMRPLGSRPVRPAPPAGSFRPDGRIVAIGSSTGGVEALLAIVSSLPANCPPTLITQHMPPTFTRSFAVRMNQFSAAHVSEAVDGAPVETGRVYLAPGGGTHLELSGSGPYRCRLREGDLVNGHRPSVDVLFASVARLVGAKSVGVILTGMGRDGATGLLTMRQAGAATIGQDEASCVIYGMPRVAHEIGGVERQLPLGSIGAAILSLCNLDNRKPH